MNENSSIIPRPLVRANQWFIVISVLLAWILHAYWLLALPLGAGVLGLLGYNPVMRLVKILLKHPISYYIPEDRDQQQFNQWISVICLFFGLAGGLLHWQAVYLVFSAMVGLAAFIAILGFCVGCFIRYQWTQYLFRRSTKHSAL